MALALLAAPAVLVPACSDEGKEYDKAVIVLGFDGMEPLLTEQMMDEGRLPNFAKLRKQGGFKNLGTATPPQSPVAWACFATGLNPGGHGLFDFIARDPNPADPNKTIDVYSAMSRPVPTKSWWLKIPSAIFGESISLGGHEVPLISSEHELLRFGTPFWNYLTDAGVPTWIYRLPANFPAITPPKKNFYCLTDMGTPDLAGGHGEFAFYTDGAFDVSKGITGGKAYRVQVLDGVVLPRRPLVSTMVKEIESPTRLVLRGRFKTRREGYEDCVAVFRRPGGGECVRPITEVDVARRTITLESPCDFKLGESAYARVFDRCQLYGPENTTVPKEKGRTVRAAADFTVYIDPEDPVACIEVGDHKVLLEEGEWSGWYDVEFPMTAKWWVKPLLPPANGTCRFYLKQVRPEFALYVTPINYDPLEPVIPLCAPSGFSEKVAKVVGRYYTQGLPEDYKALSHDVLNRDEFLQQANLVAEERMELLDYALGHYKGGFLFFYYGGTDLVAHMFWATRDANHPGVTQEEHDRYARTIEEYYVVADRMLGQTLEQVEKRFPDALVLVMSDHGFEMFARGFNLNTWLAENGYTTMLVPGNREMPMNIDFAKSRAYGLGINGLFLNLKGREKSGIVDPPDRQALLDEISQKLLKVVDPKTGERVIKEVYQTDRVYSGPYTANAPDLQIGYARGYRGGWGTTLGAFPKEIIEDNVDAWGADHCIATDLVPGIILSNWPLTLPEPDLTDLAPTILKAFGITPPEELEGEDVLR